MVENQCKDFLKKLFSFLLYIVPGQPMGNFFFALEILFSICASGENRLLYFDRNLLFSRRPSFGGCVIRIVHVAGCLVEAEFLAT